MANIAKQAGPIKNPTVAGDIPVVTMTASTPAGDLVDISGGNVVLIVRNSDASNPYTVTINGEPGAEGRDVSITKSLAAGEIAIFGPAVGPGWMTAAGRLSVASENAAILYGVIDLHR